MKTEPEKATHVQAVSDETGAAGSTRRAFLRESGAMFALAALAQATPAASAGSVGPAGSVKPVAIDVAGGETTTTASNGIDLVDWVNVLQGTASTRKFSTGNTLPIAAVPFGMAHWTLQSVEDSPWFFQPDQRRVQGVRCTHQLSPWLGDYGYATFLPFRGVDGVDEPRVGPDARASSYRPEDARLTPYSLDLFLLRYRARLELVPTCRCGVLSIDFSELDQQPGEATEEKAHSGLIIDIPKTATGVEQPTGKRQIRFTSTATTGGTPANFATYYVVEFSRPWDSVTTSEAGEGRIAVVKFNGLASVRASIATSFISFEQAEFNLAREIGDASLAELRSRAKGEWDQHLGRITIDGATDEQRRTFYSCLYRTLLFPRVWHEPDPGGGVHHFSAFNGKVQPGVMYADHGYWDVYRAWYPLMSILFPERLGEILQAWVNAYHEGGWFPQFPSPGYRACMTGSLIDSVFGDAAAKKIGGFDLAAAYEGLKKHATTVGDPSKGYGRVGFEQYVKLNYVPADLIHQSAAETVDAAYGDFCIAQAARALGKEADAAYFEARSANWKNLFDKNVRFIRGKNSDGSWLTPFDPFTWGSPYVEASAWQHRWDAPQDIEGMISAMNGPAAAAEALERMLSVPARFNVGIYGEEIHEMSEMAAVLFGQYAQSNQPSHHLLYLFAHAGRPDRTQFWVRRVLQALYSSHTYPGDEDTGSMAAWYVLSSLGFYPTCPGKPEYTLGSPLFRRAVVNLPNQKKLVVSADLNGPAIVLVKAVTLNGHPVGGATVQHEAICAGGTLTFEMDISGRSAPA